MVTNLRRVTVAISVLWVVLTLGVLRWLVSEAYAGTGLDVLNQMFASRRGNPLSHYLAQIYLLAGIGVVAILAGGFGLVALIRDADRGSPVARRVVLPASAASLAGIRIGVVAVALLMTLLEDPASTALLPRWSELPFGMGGMKLVRQLPGVDALLSSSGALSAVKAVTVLALGLALVGFRTRVALVVALAGALVLGAVLRTYTHFFHTGLLPVYLLAVLSVVRCGDAWSVDAWLQRRAGKPVPAPEGPTMEYGWARFILWSVIALTYFAAGTSKLRHGGWLWWDGVNLKSKLLADVLQINSIELPWAPLIGHVPSGVFSLLGLGTLLVEVGFIAVPFSRMARAFFPLAAVGLHAGVFLVQEILFLDLMLIQIVFFNVRRFALPLERWTRSRWPALGPAEPARVTEETAAAKVPLRTLLLAMIPLGYCGTIALATESYPITTWSMYSSRTQSTRVEYILFHGLDSAGRKIPLRFEDTFGLLRFNRVYDIVPRAFYPSDEQQPLRDLLNVFAEIRDRERASGDRLAAFQFDLRAWDYAREPGDPERGVTVSTFVHRVGTTGPGDKP